VTKDDHHNIGDIFHKAKISPKEKKENIVKESPPAKYTIFDEEEFTRGRKVLGGLIVHGMITSGGTDIDWLIEHNGGFIIFEFKGFHRDKIGITRGQMLAYENLHEQLNKITKCYVYFVGSYDIDFSNPDDPMWIFEMKQWKNGTIPKISSITEKIDPNAKRFTVFRDLMEPIKVSDLRFIIEKHWSEFKTLKK
jgi:hypothetical protein